ncbi:MAG: ATP-binding protein [Fidelibacterota bacterium]
MVEKIGLPMAFERIVGQERAKKILLRAIENGRLAHAYLFAGNDGLGKEAMSIELARLLNCRGTDKPCGTCRNCIQIDKLSHPNLKIIFPLPSGSSSAGGSPLKGLSQKEMDTIHRELQLKSENLYRPVAVPGAHNILINSIRELKREIYYSPLEGTKVVVFFNAHKMTQEASNALLKILEEPPSRTVMVITTSRIHALLPTIISRCQIIKFTPLSEGEIENALILNNKASPEKANLAARLSSGSYGKALNLIEADFSSTVQQLKEFLEVVKNGSYRDVAVMVGKLSALRYEEITDLIDFLKFLILWFRDALIIKQIGDERGETLKLNRMFKSEIENFLKSHPDINIADIIELLENSIDLIDKNIYINLILYNLIISMRKSIGKRYE